MTTRKLTDAVATALAEIERQFPDAVVTAREDGEGGAFVLIEDIALSKVYSQERTWGGFHITFQYPYADVYPHFVRGDLSRADGGTLGEGTSATQFENRSAIQLSRRSNQLNAATDTAVLKLLKVMEWLNNRS